MQKQALLISVWSIIFETLKLVSFWTNWPIDWSVVVHSTTQMEWHKEKLTIWKRPMAMMALKIHATPAPICVSRYFLQSASRYKFNTNTIISYWTTYRSLIFQNCIIRLVIQKIGSWRSLIQRQIAKSVSNSYKL